MEISKLVKYAVKCGVATPDDWNEFLRNVPQSTYTPRVVSPQSVLPLLSAHGYEKQERFVIVTLDGAHTPIRTHIVSVGLVNRTVVHPREVFRLAIGDNAVAIIVAHNHPSGALQPSPEDVEITRRLHEAGEIVGIDVLDHLIVGRSNAYYSFGEQGLMPKGVSS